MIKKRFVLAVALILLTFAVPLTFATEDISSIFYKDKNGLYEWTGSFVVDAADVLSGSERAELKEFLLKLNDETSVQIAVLTTPTTDGEPIHDFAVRQFEKWQLGQKGVDNGALLTVAWDDRKLDITTGDGTEGILTDAKCGKIIREVLTPAFREGRQGEGIISAVKNMAGIITQDESLVSVTEEDSEDEETDDTDLSWEIIKIALAIYIIVRLIRGDSLIPFLYGKSSHKGGSSRSYKGTPHSSSRSSSSSYRSGGGGRTSGGGASGSW